MTAARAINPTAPAPMVLTASDLMLRSVGDRRPEPKVYGRTRRPCYRCRTPIRAATLGTRTVYWCPTCQPPVASVVPGTT